jgi:flagellar biosynthetic protein FliQ
MDEAVLLEVGRDAVIVALKLGAPLMLIALLIGLVISLFQALTQIQEVTLTFVPKIIVVFISTLLLAPFMLHTLIDFTERIMLQAIG